MLFSEVVALGIARAPRYGFMEEQSCGGMSQLGVGQLVCLFSQEPRGDDSLNLEITDLQQCNPACELVTRAEREGKPPIFPDEELQTGAPLMVKPSECKW